MRKSTGNNKPQRAFDAKRPGAGAAQMVTKIRKIAAPKPPANASMSSMGGKLRKGDC
jgi:hypothetical protein